MSVRRLDHIAVVVKNIDVALKYFTESLGLAVAASEELIEQRLRLAYLDTGNSFVQLVQPMDETSDIGRWLTEHGEGLHHICFGVDDVAASIQDLCGSQPASLGSGRGRTSGFLPGDPQHGVRIECTEFNLEIDVESSEGWLNNGSHDGSWTTARTSRTSAD